MHDQVKQLHTDHHRQVRHTSDRRRITTEPKRTEERLVVDEDSKHTQVQKDLHKRHGDQLGRMTVLPVAQLMREHGLNFIRRGLLDQRIVNDNVLAAARHKAVEVRIRVATTPTSVDHVQVLEREIELLRKRCHTITQHALRQRRQLVEQRLDERGVDDRAKYDDCHDQQHNVHDKLIPRPPHDRDKERNQWHRNDPG